MWLAQIVENIALLITLSFVYNIIQRRYRHASPLLRSILTGGLFGIIGVATMLRPIEFVPGVIFDMRFTMVALAAVFEGSLPGIIAGLIIGVTRLLIGGVGALPAVGASVTTIGLGIAVYRLKKQPPVDWHVGRFLLLGLLVSTIMILWTLTLPADVALAAVRALSLPLLIGYPVATAFVGNLLSNEIHHHEAEKRLQDNERKYRTLFEDSHDAIFLIQANGRILDVNRQGARLFGYGRDELLAMNVIDLYVDPATRGDFMARAMQDGVVRDYPLQLRKKDSTVIEALITSSLQTREGDLSGRHQSIVRDVTEQKTVERELTEYREHLEVLVQQRTSELEEANQQLKHLSKIKDEFVSNISHELRSPLTSLKIHLELLEHRPEKRAQYIETLIRETQRLQDLVEDLLYLSRLDQAQIPSNITDLDLNQLVKDYVTDRQPVAEQHNLTLILETHPNLPLVNGDTGQIWQVVSVLLTNAINYTPPDGSITVKTRHCYNDDCGMVGFSVTDTGPGIHPDDRGRVFERFFRGRIALDTGTPGTGLGLAIAREIVERHGGRIELADDDEHNTGATFMVWLPALDVNSSAAK